MDRVRVLKPLPFANVGEIVEQFNNLGEYRFGDHYEIEVDADTMSEWADAGWVEFLTKKQVNELSLMDELTSLFETVADLCDGSAHAQEFEEKISEEYHRMMDTKVVQDFYERLVDERHEEVFGKE